MLAKLGRPGACGCISQPWKPARPNPTHLGERAVPGLPVPSPTKLASTLKNLVSGVKEAFSQ